MAITGPRGTTPLGHGDITGRVYRTNQASAAANREIRLAMGQKPAGYVERVTEEARSAGWSRGYDKGAEAGLASGWRDGWNDLANALVDGGLLTAEQILAIANGEDAPAAELPAADPAPVELAAYEAR